MGISTPGIGSGLDVDSIVTKLMQVESQPLQVLDKKSASYEAKVSALGGLSGAVGTFQGAMAGLSSVAGFNQTTATSADATVMVGNATSAAAAGIYDVNVTQLAQSQSLASKGVVSATAAVGLGNPTTLTFQLGTVTGGSFGLAASALSAGVQASGISNGSLSVNGTVIATDASTRSAKALADAINAKFATTGVSASASPAASSATLFGSAGASSFGTVDTSAGTYALAVNGIQIASQGTGAGALDAAGLDAILGGSNSVTAALAAADITVSGSAAAGDLVFTAADGSNLSITETVTGSVNGGIGKDSATANNGSGVTVSAGVTLNSSNASPITIAGTNPALAGLTAGTGGAYLGTGFEQDNTRVSGVVQIDSTNNSLQGIRDAINKANIGITATIVSDGSAAPNHLILSSTKTGATSSMKVSVSGANGGVADAAVEALLGYDPTGAQNMTQTSAAQDTKLNVNGVAITSATTSVSEAIQGVTLTVGRVGRANLVVARDSASVNTSVGNFVKAYNDLTKAIKDATSYNPETKRAGPLLGDPTVRALQMQVRKQLSQAVTGLAGDLTTLSSVGIAFQKDGTLLLDSSKLSSAIKDKPDALAGLFAAVGKASDPLVAFNTSTSKTVPGDYAVNITTLATQGTLAGDLALGPSTTIAADTSWTVTLNETTPTTPNRTATVALQAGNYSAAQLATLIQSAINGTTSFSNNGLAVNVTAGTDGKLSMVSVKYGAVSNLTVTSTTGTAVSDIFGGATPVAGVDVAGTIGGQAATGSGQSLTGAAGSDVAGLKIDVTGGALGDRGTVGFSQGYAYQLNNLASNFLGASGLISNSTKGLTQTITDIGKQKDAFSDKLAAIEKRYRAQYTALDKALASMNSTSTFLTQQFAALTASTK